METVRAIKPHRRPTGEYRYLALPGEYAGFSGSAVTVRRLLSTSRSTKLHLSGRIASTGLGRVSQRASRGCDMTRTGASKPIEPTRGSKNWSIKLQEHIMNRHLTAIIEREDDGYVALCPEVDVASQGKTVAEAHDNLQEALGLFFETLRCCCADVAPITSPGAGFAARPISAVPVEYAPADA